MEDRGLKIEDGWILDPQSSILNPPSSILHPRNPKVAYEWTIDGPALRHSIVVEGPGVHHCGCALSRGWHRRDDRHVQRSGCHVVKAVGLLRARAAGHGLGADTGNQQYNPDGGDVSRLARAPAGVLASGGDHFS